ncbi:alpha/beta hydrolase [Chitinophaga agrisoli]|uniref:Alpha/beta hydrolase n=1 Tax=Chitinophaga agrisoli TaxID=2607653 RepID=A0A5B2VKH8_9BACT|nr:alpha/beta hydrolase [Chitinophaga agrisoli]KAA2239304.1 alpha/beta hydrolase [Chitinophaga agrisoli]
MPVVALPHTRLHVQEMNAGAPETVLLVHGMFTNLSIWYFNIAPLLAQHFHVVLYDLKGHGMSDKAGSGYGLQVMSEELLALMDTLQLDTVHLCGYSYGGLIALQTAIHHPERIKRLAVIESPDPQEQETMNIVDIYSKELLTHFVNGQPAGAGAPLGKRQLERRHRMYEFLLKESTIRQDMQQEQHFFEQAAITRIPHDTLLIYGSDSDCVPAGQALQEKISRASLLYVNGDHNIPVQSPFVIGEALQDFFVNGPVKNTTAAYVTDKADLNINLS